MPVIGHAIAGFTLAAWSYPPRRRGNPRPEPTPASWALVLIVLAYLPDIIGQVLALAGWRDLRFAGHSLVIGAAAATAAAFFVAAATGTARSTSFLLALTSIALHDALDVLDGSNRMLLWPLSGWQIDADVAVFHSGVMGEIWPLAPAAIAVAAWRWFSLPSRPGRPVASDWVSMAAIAAIVCAAGAVHALRGDREQDLARAKALMGERRYAEVLQACERAEQWPSTVRPARINYLRAEAWLGLGDRAKAEAYYLLAYRIDPSDFWTVADLAVLYASGEGAPNERERRAAPWLAVMRADFGNHPALPRNLERVRRALGAPAVAR